MRPPWTPRRVVIALALLALLAWVGARLHVSEEEALEAAWVALVDAVAAESAPDVDARLLPALTWSGPDIVGRGGHDEALARLRQFWDESSAMRWVPTKTTAVVQGSVGVVETRGRLAFRYGSFQTGWKASFRASFLRHDGVWGLQSLAVVSLDRGLL